jgi:hypothetical protein
MSLQTLEARHGNNVSVTVNSSIPARIEVKECTCNHLATRHAEIVVTYGTDEFKFKKA